MGRDDRSRERNPDIELEAIALLRSGLRENPLHAFAEVTDRFGIGGAGSRVPTRGEV